MQLRKVVTDAMEIKNCYRKGKAFLVHDRAQQSKVFT